MRRRRRAGDAAIDLRDRRCGRSSARTAPDPRPPPGLSSDAQSMVRPSSRGGVPVFSRPSLKPARVMVADRPSDACSFMRPATIFLSPIWIRPRRKVPVVSTTAPQASRRPSASMTAATRPSTISKSRTSPSTTSRSFCSPNRCLHGQAIELAVGLGARPAHRRTLAAVEQAELDAGGDRRPGPSARPWRRSRGPDGPCRGRRSPDCTTSRRSYRSAASPARSVRRRARRHWPPRNRHGRRPTTTTS